MAEQQNFQYGGMESDMGAPPIETMGARYGIGVVMPVYPQRGAPGPLVEPYLMPPYHGRNGSNERTVPAIVQTPLGGMVPGPALPPPIVHGAVGAAMVPGHEAMEFTMGIGDGWPEGFPVPVR